MQVEVIEKTVDGVERFTHLGQEGFTFFAVLIVALMFVLMGFVTYKSQKTMITTLTDKHDENARAIAHAHDRIHDLEERENECIKRLDKATSKLESCTSKLEGCFGKLKGLK